MWDHSWEQKRDKSMKVLEWSEGCYNGYVITVMDEGMGKGSRAFMPSACTMPSRICHAFAC